MKILRLILLLGIPSLLLAYCHNIDNRRTDNLPTIFVETKNISPKIKFSEMIKDYQFIPLETNEISLIGQIDKIILHNNQYYILDGSKAKEIFVFSSDGKFVRKISKIGKGPGEYLNLNDFCFEPKTNNLVILDRRNLKYYNEDGAYLKTIELPASSWRFDYSGQNNISLNCDGNGDGLVIIDENGKIASSFFPYIKETKLMLQRPFQKYGESELLYLSNFDYTIYKISGSQVSPHIKINFEKDMFTQKDLASLMENKNNRNNFYQIKYYFEGPSNIFIFFMHKKMGYLLSHNKISQKTIIVNYNDIENDLTFTNGLPNIVTNDSTDTYISFIETNNLRNDLTNKNVTDSRLNKIITNLKLTDNPVLILFKFR